MSECRNIFLFHVLVWRGDTSDGAASNTDGGTSYLFRHSLCLERIIHPCSVPFKGAFRLSFNTIAIRIHTSISTMGELKELILRLVIGTSISNSGNGKLRILDPIIFRSAFSQGTTVRSDNSRMALIFCAPSKKNGPQKKGGRMDHH